MPNLKVNTAEEAKLNNIVDIALMFSAMIRLMKKGSKKQLKDKILSILNDVFHAESSTQYDMIHDNFCNWGMQSIVLAEKKKTGLIIKESTLHGAVLHGHHDHRVVMALSIAGMMAGENTIIDTAEAVSVTYPGYVKTMRQLGAKFTLLKEVN